MMKISKPEASFGWIDDTWIITKTRRRQRIAKARLEQDQNRITSSLLCSNHSASILSMVTLLLLVCYFRKETPAPTLISVNAFLQQYHHHYHQYGVNGGTGTVRVFLSSSSSYQKRAMSTTTTRQKSSNKPRITALADNKSGTNSNNNEERGLDKSNNNSNNADDKANVVGKVRNYFRERQIRKDAEILRAEVNRRQEGREQQLKRDATELRIEVQRREKEQARKLKKYQQQLAANREKKKQAYSKNNDTTIDGSGSMSITKMMRKKQTQASAAEEEGKANTSSSKSRRIKDFVGSAQKAVSGVVEQITKNKGNKEEWIVVAPKTRISPGEIVAVTAAGIDLLLIASRDGSALHCVANSCPHLGTPLEVGSLERLPIESTTTDIGDKDSNDDDNSELKIMKDMTFFRETDISRMLKQDGCEDCIVCPLHKTAFALESGEVRGEWCPYPPVIGKLTGALKKQSNLPVFDVRTRGKNIEVRLNTPVEISGDD